MLEEQDQDGLATYESENVVVVLRRIIRNTEHNSYMLWSYCILYSPDFLLPLLILLHSSFMRRFI
jgi:hypothetical protein